MFTTEKKTDCRARRMLCVSCLPRLSPCSLESRALVPRGILSVSLPGASPSLPAHWRSWRLSLPASPRSSQTSCLSLSPFLPPSLSPGASPTLLTSYGSSASPPSSPPLPSSFFLPFPPRARVSLIIDTPLSHPTPPSLTPPAQVSRVADYASGSRRVPAGALPFDRGSAQSEQCQRTSLLAGGWSRDLIPGRRRALHALGTLSVLSLLLAAGSLPDGAMRTALARQPERSSSRDALCSPAQGP